MLTSVSKQMKRGVKIPLSVRYELYEAADGKCEARLSGCSYHGADSHHRKLRSRGGSNELSNLLLLCRSCHDKITDNKPGTDKYRTFSYQSEGTDEGGMEWQPTREAQN